MGKSIEVITVHIGQDLNTYELNDWLENEENATPIRSVKNPHKENQVPFVKLTLTTKAKEG